ncbi:hypothetical protein DFA_04086 [Cavenderia fasciculata]|uniref:Uncharacterized protein n=1 Tax=Cavenderia fasciculata TaxID=261658 RepID=F4Q191_CACFS|nr:uncharacterized protein DFA_04086 [Cavenderia fasciculata]EGG18592.1 hypothetical protein DFA_04086 [Cavenderia fasciculata]|eukprot:XP_004366496.1 hypothetical protein DFA_04086 [Cavenderia fasciculata]
MVLEEKEQEILEKGEDVVSILDYRLTHLTNQLTIAMENEHGGMENPSTVYLRIIKEELELINMTMIDDKTDTSFIINDILKGANLHYLVESIVTWGSLEQLERLSQLSRIDNDVFNDSEKSRILVEAMKRGDIKIIHHVMSLLYKHLYVVDSDQVDSSSSRSTPSSSILAQATKILVGYGFVGNYGQFDIPMLEILSHHFDEYELSNAINSASQAENVEALDFLLTKIKPSARHLILELDDGRWKLIGRILEKIDPALLTIIRIRDQYLTIHKGSIELFKLLHRYDIYGYTSKSIPEEKLKSANYGHLEYCTFLDQLLESERSLQQQSLSSLSLTEPIQQIQQPLQQPDEHHHHIQHLQKYGFIRYGHLDILQYYIQHPPTTNSTTTTTTTTTTMTTNTDHSNNNLFDFKFAVLKALETGQSSLIEATNNQQLLDTLDTTIFIQNEQQEKEKMDESVLDQIESAFTSN